MNIVELIRQETVHFDSQHGDGSGCAATISYGELLHRIAALKELLLARGIVTGHRIAFHCGDGIDYVIGSLALLDCGAAVVPLADHSPLWRCRKRSSELMCAES